MRNYAEKIQKFYTLYLWSDVSDPCKQAIIEKIGSVCPLLPALMVQGQPARTTVVADVLVEMIAHIYTKNYMSIACRSRWYAMGTYFDLLRLHDMLVCSMP